jgi:hypothetical protein
MSSSTNNRVVQVLDERTRRMVKTKIFMHTVGENKYEQPISGFRVVEWLEGGVEGRLLGFLAPEWHDNGRRKAGWAMRDAQNQPLSGLFSHCTSSFTGCLTLYNLEYYKEQIEAAKTRLTGDTDKYPEIVSTCVLFLATHDRQDLTIDLTHSLSGYIYTMQKQGRNKYEFGTLDKTLLSEKVRSELMRSWCRLLSGEEPDPALC